MIEAGYAFHSKGQGYLLRGLKEEEDYYNFDVGFYNVEQR